MRDTESALIEKRIALLTEFHGALSEYFNADDREQCPELRAYLNRHLVAVSCAVRDAGTNNRIVVSPPPAFGGGPQKSLDPLQNLFLDYFGRSLIPQAQDNIEQAIGVYEHLLEGSGLVKIASPQAIDIEAAVERALRPSFKEAPPSDERAVQDALEIIFQSIGIEYVRDREVAPVGAKAFKPDFVVPCDDLALEVKFARSGRPLAELQEELAADVAAYRTKWKRLLVVIYDCGLISDPYAFRKSNMTSFGVSMVIVKH